MSNTKQTGCLVLAPAPATSIPRNRLLEYLHDCGFIGDAFSNGSTADFLIGERFLQLITFMGCSPHIELTPPADGRSFCHVRIRGPLDQPLLLAGGNAQAPRCPSCRGRIEPWRELLDEWHNQAASPIVTCPHCGEKQRPMELNWRRQAG